MEEIKKVDVQTTENNEDSKPSYEQLKNWCEQLLMQRNQVAKELRQVTDIMNKLPWLFKVLENEGFFPKEFLNNCVKEIIEIMTPPIEEKEPSKEE